MIEDGKVIILLFCKEFVTWANCFGMFVAWFIAE
jgi:hypothetical protein